MHREPEAMVQIHRIQETIYEEGKHLSPTERLERLRRETEAYLKRAGLTLTRVQPPARTISR